MKAVVRVQVLIFLAISARSACQEIQIASEDFFPKRGTFNMVMEDYEQGKKVRSYEFDGKKYDDDYYILIATQPKVMLGWVQLRVGAIIYNYTRKADIYQQYSAKSAFLGSLFSQEDIMSAKLATLYEPVIEEIDELDGRECVKVVFLPRTTGMSYAKIATWYDLATKHPIRRTYYSKQDKAIKQMDITSIELESGTLTQFGFTMRDLLREGYFTTVLLASWDSSANINAAMFTKSAMKSLAR